MAGTAPGPTGPRTRRSFAISLRASMLLVLVVGGLLGWKARRASLQRRAVAAIQRLGGSTFYDWEVAHDWRSDPDAASVPGPAWLRRIVGDEYFQDVAAVSLPGWSGEWSATAEFHRALEADQLACLDGLDGIESLQIQSMALGPEAVARLGRLARLKRLALFVKPLDAEALNRLGTLVDLESLVVSVKAGDARSLAFLDRLPNLAYLTIVGGPVSDDGLAVIGRQHGLDTLSLEGPGLTDAGLAHLRGVGRLGSLRIASAAGITEEGLARLAELRELFLLDLPGTAATEAGLARIGKLPNLVDLTVSPARFDDGVLDRFRRARPGLKVHTQP